MNTLKTVVCFLSGGVKPNKIVETKKFIISYSIRASCKEIGIKLIEHYYYLPLKAPTELL